MKSRIITGVVGIALLTAVLLLPPIVLYIAMAVTSLLAMIELLIATNFVKHRGVLAASLTFAACVPFFVLFHKPMPALFALLAYTATLVVMQLKYYDTLPVEHTSFAFFTSLIFPASFSCLAYLRSCNARDGLFYVILAIGMAWLSDIGAYFVGTFCGKTRLCPKISPKKTVEGLIGGIVSSVVLSVGIAWVYQIGFLKEAATVSLWQIAVLALACAPLSVLGDLFASVIKRQTHVKDFGNVLPGHGGVMDRFDSLLLVAPLLALLVYYVPFIY